MIAGHPFKGGFTMSTGFLQHPDMKRFGLNDSTFFIPPRPSAWASMMGVGAMGTVASGIPSFDDFFSTYFAGRSFNVTEPKCNTMLEGMKKCYENHAEKNPVNTCQYYIQGFERFACGK